jgi:hypothetical protein
MKYRAKIKTLLTEIKDNEISKYLLSLEGSKQEIDEIDISSDGFISFKKNDKKNRNKIKAGRFISKFPNEYTARDIEIFVNLVKARAKYTELYGNFEMGSGEDVLFSYSIENYATMSGSLAGSCMNNVGENRLKLYKDNPKKVKVLMLKDNDGKLLGRCIVWKNSFISEGANAAERNEFDTLKATVLDRVYSTQDYIIDLFQKYALEHGYYFRMGGMSFINPSNERVSARIKTNLTNFEFSGYPYLDTMRSVSKKGTISNKMWKQDLRFY